MLQEIQGSREKDCCRVHHVHQVSTPPCSAAPTKLPATGQHPSETRPLHHAFVHAFTLRNATGMKVRCEHCARL